jgi:dienelactone hydrolase
MRGAVKKKQEPLRPFPYLEREVTFSNPLDATLLRGTLTYPNRVGRFPAVVLVTGSGAHDRNEEILGHKPFLVLSDYLTRNGIAVLRYDDRHYKMPIEKGWSFTTLDLAGDTKAAMDFLRACDVIDTDFIGVCGHSEGGLIAAIVASERKDVSFAISLAGPGLAGHEIGKNQSVALTKNSKAQRYALDLCEINRTEP